MQIVEELVVQNLFIIFPLRPNSKLSVLEGRNNLEKMKKDKLHGILIAYKMRTKKENPSKKEVAFTVTKKTKCNEEKQNKNTYDG